MIWKKLCPYRGNGLDPRDPITRSWSLDGGRSSRLKTSEICRKREALTGSQLLIPGILQKPADLTAGQKSLAPDYDSLDNDLFSILTSHNSLTTSRNMPNVIAAPIWEGNHNI